jgi:hypothetical protein
MYNDAFNGLAHWWDSLFMETPREVESDEFTGEEFDDDDDDGFRNMALDEEANPCDSEDVEEDGIE